MRTRGSGIRARRSGWCGFTLLEMMLVVVVIGILATVVVVNLAASADTGRRGATVAILAQVKGALTQYKARHGVYPKSLDQLGAGTNPILERSPLDGWRRALDYACPGTAPQQPFSLVSRGEDGEAGSADDINVWTMDDMD